MPFRATSPGFGALGLALIMALWPADAPAHDASAWGGVFRTRDAGATWLPVNPSSFVSGAIALAISPADPHHLLLATDMGVSRSRNGGRDWAIEGRDLVVAPAFAAVFDADGERALIAGASAILHNIGHGWRQVQSPAGSSPARALVSGSNGRHVYLAGWAGLYRTDDWGDSWVNVGNGIVAEHVSAVAAPLGPSDDVYVLAGGRLWASADAGVTWHLRGEGFPPPALEVVTPDPSDSHSLWSVAAGQVFRTDDQGRHWRAVGVPVPEPVVARAVAVVDNVILMATDRGLYRGSPGGARWSLASDNLAAHLEAGFLARDPRSPATVYVGFSLTPYDALWRRAAEGSGALSRLELVELAGGLAFLMLLLLAAVAAVRRLARTHYPSSRLTPR
jgi:photosystem II stability/assembly factor-like uncharacterized protein